MTIEFEELERFGIVDTEKGDTLAHYGVKGMKWGVRKDRSSGSDSSSKKKSSSSKKSGKKQSQFENYDRNKPYVSVSGDSGLMFVGGIGGEGMDEYEEYKKEIDDILNDDSLSVDEKMKALAVARDAFVARLEKKYDVDLSIPKDLGKKDSFLDGLKKNLGSFVEDTKKNVGDLVGDAKKNVDNAINEFKRNTTRQTTLSRKVVTTPGGNRVVQETTTVRDGLGDVISVEEAKRPIIKYEFVPGDKSKLRLKESDDRKEVKHSLITFDEDSDELADIDDILTHWGVKGMKWGVRKRRDGSGVERDKSKMAGNHPGQSKTSGRATRAERRARRADPKNNAKRDTSKQTTSDKSESKPAAPAKKDTSSMTNDELQATIRRLQLDAQYSQLTASKGDRFRGEAKKLMGEIFRETVKSVSKEIINKGTSEAMAGFPTVKAMKEKAKAQAAKK